MKRLGLFLTFFICMVNKAAMVTDNQTDQTLVSPDIAAAAARLAPVAVRVPVGAGAIPASVGVVPAITTEDLYRLEMQQINYELSQFYADHARLGGRIGNRDWHDFARGLVARHPDILELRCDKASGPGKLYIRYSNPFYIQTTATSPECHIYIRPHVNVPIVPSR